MGKHWANDEVWGKGKGRVQTVGQSSLETGLVVIGGWPMKHTEMQRPVSKIVCLG